MKKYILISLVIATASSPAWAKTSRATLAPAPDSVELSLPQSTIRQFEVNEPDPAAKFLPGPSGEVGISLSSWTPSNYSLYSQIGGTSAFSSTGIPTFSLNYTSQGTTYRAGRLALQTGVDFASLQRTAVSDQVNVSQNLYLFPVHLGAEFLPSAIALHRGNFAIESYLSAAALPALGLTTYSAIDHNHVLGTISGQARLGALIRMQSVAIDLGVSQTVGDLEGTGVSAGVRLPL